MFYTLLLISIYQTVQTITTHNFGSTTVTLTTISTSLVLNTTPSDTCNLLVARNKYLFHVSSTNSIQIAPKGSLATYTNLIDANISSGQIVALGLNSQESVMVLMRNQTVNTMQVYLSNSGVFY
jgi:hypothetical protein